MNNTVDNKVEDDIMDFLRSEALKGRLEGTTREIASGSKLVYNQVGKALERLRMKGKVGYRERGTENKPTRYYNLIEVVESYRRAYKNKGKKATGEP